MKRIYLAGPIFTAADQLWMGALKKKLQSNMTARGHSVEIVWPFEKTPKFGARGDHTRAMAQIFEVCVNEIKSCQLIVAILDGPQVDDGTAWEIGYFHCRHGPKNIFGLRTDLRNAGDLVGGKVNSLVEASLCGISRSENDLFAAVACNLNQRDF